jgi:sec-independent protein translocase protein TatB
MSNSVSGHADRAVTDHTRELPCPPPTVWEHDVPGLQEMLVIGVVALLVFGPDRLPELARNAGKFLGKIRAQTDKGMSEIRGMSEIQDLQRELQTLRREINGVTSPLTGGGGSNGSTRRMVPASQDGGRPTTDATNAAARPDDAPPPTDPDAT